MRNRIKKKIYNKFFKEFHSNPAQPNYSDITKAEWDIINCVKPFTLTNPERLVSLIKAVEYIETNGIQGSIVECGVWKGGSIMAILQALINLKSFHRDIYLYDTFEGMSKPTEKDESYKGESAAAAYERKNEFWKRIKYSSQLNEVKNNFNNIEYPSNKIHFIKGRIEETIPNDSTPEKISLLRLDTDWYESTYHEMNHLYPRLVSGGIIIIDDYGHWKGCKEAVDEYISENNLELFLSRIDYTCRIGIKR